MGFSRNLYKKFQCQSYHWLRTPSLMPTINNKNVLAYT
jgi:hypothetical protein